MSSTEVIFLLLGILVTLVTEAVIWFWPARKPETPGVAPPVPASPASPDDAQVRREQAAFSRDLRKILNYAAKPPGGEKYDR